jgi:transposase-like protein
VLQRWRRRFAGGTGKQTPTGNDKSASVDNAEMEKLRKELAQVKEEREVLEFILKVMGGQTLSRNAIFSA